MAKEIGRLNSFALGIESTPGTAGTLDAYIPYESANLTPKTTLIENASALGVIDAVSGKNVSQTYSEFSAGGIAYSQSVGYLLLLALGTAGSPTLVETGVYSHAFTRKNDNSHPSATVYKHNLTQQEQSTYHMLESLNVKMEVGNYAKYEAKTVGRGLTNATGLTPTFVTADEPFLVSKASIKFANDIAGLSGASRVAVQAASLTIEKNLTQIYGTQSTTTEALEFSTQHNQDFRVTGDFEIVYDADTYKTLAAAGTAQAIEIVLEGKALIGATKHNTLTIQIAQAYLEDWERSDDIDGIMTQTFGFTAAYKLGETKTMTATLQNNKTTQYA